LKKIDCLIINEDEARMLAVESNLVRASQKILDMGLSVVVIKKGESGSITSNTEGATFVLPAFPSAEVKDPTGAGDSFAGGFMGYLAQCGGSDFESLKTAVAYGTVVSSFTISEFSLHGLTSINRGDIDGRLAALRKVTQF
jgi:sugar/nucleoside kinase (ribokinase family)